MISDEEITIYVYAVNEEEILVALSNSDIPSPDWKEVSSEIDDNYECKKDDIIIDTVSRDIVLAVIRNSEGSLEITTIPAISSDKITEQTIRDLTPDVIFPIDCLQDLLNDLSEDRLKPTDYSIRMLKRWLEAQRSC